MAVTVQFSTPPQEALRMGLPYFDMFILGWGGSSVVHGDNQGLIYPFAASDAVLPPPRGIAIHAQSDIDRVMIETSVGANVQSAAVRGSTTAAVNSQSFSLSVESPLFLSPPAIPIVTTTAPATPVRPTIYLRAHPDAIYHTQYAKVGTSALTDFTAALIPNLTAKPAFMVPLLGLRFYLQTPPLPATRTRLYHPEQRQGRGKELVQPVPVVAGAPAGEQLFAIIPIHGRKQLMASFRSVGCAPAIRVAVNDFSELAPENPPVAGSEHVQLERTQYTTTLTANAPVQTLLTPAGDWLMLYYTANDGDNGTLMWTLREV